MKLVLLVKCLVCAFTLEFLILLPGYGLAMALDWIFWSVAFSWPLWGLALAFSEAETAET